MVQNKPLAALYVRVSTEEQARQGFSLAAQEDALKNYATALGYAVFKIYKDEGKSAKDIKHRPALQELLKHASEKQFNALFVYKLDRFSRSLKDLILTIEKLKEQGVDFISLQDKIETASASGKLMFHIISSFAEFERDIISERTTFGMAEKAKEGGIVTKAPLGYIIINGQLQADKEKAGQLKHIFDTFLNSDISLTQLAKQNNMTTRGIIQLLKNSTYTGIIKFRKDYEGRHEAIVSDEIFNKAQEKLKAISLNNAMKKNPVKSLDQPADPSQEHKNQEK
jgi:site-specific DNA recombinase